MRKPDPSPAARDRRHGHIAGAAPPRASGVVGLRSRVPRTAGPSRRHPDAPPTISRSAETAASTSFLVLRTLPEPSPLPSRTFRASVRPRGAVQPARTAPVPSVELEARRSASIPPATMLTTAARSAGPDPRSRTPGIAERPSASLRTTGLQRALLVTVHARKPAAAPRPAIRGCSAAGPRSVGALHRLGLGLRGASAVVPLRGAAPARRRARN